MAATTMPQVNITGIDRVAIKQVPVPAAGADDVLVQVANCGICGSDLGYIAMGGLLGPDQPMALGHELSGRVIACGERVTQVAVGDRVVVNPEAAGNHIGNSGPEGGFAPFLLVRGAATDPAAVLKLPDGLSFEQGALVEPLSVAMHAVNRSGITAGPDFAKKRAVIFGGGTIGLAIALVLRYRGVDDIVLVDLVESRLALARQLGVDSFNPGDGDLAAFLGERHGRRQLPAFGIEAVATDVYFEASGAAPAFEQALALAATGATIAVVGVHKAPVSLDLVNVLVRELNIVGAMAYPDEFPAVIDMLASGAVDPLVLVSHRYPLSQFEQALAMARDPHRAVKVMIDCQR